MVGATSSSYVTIQVMCHQLMLLTNPVINNTRPVTVIEHRQEGVICLAKLHNN